MTICYFGSYNRDYSRNRILIKGLRQNGAEVIECRAPLEAEAPSRPLTGFARLWRLFWKHWKIRNQYDAMIVGFCGQGMTLFAKLITRKPVVLDAFYSLYNTAVEDRKFHSPLSLAALYYWFLDWASARTADLVLLDTEEHIEYYVKTFHLPREKFARVFIGADDELFHPSTNNESGYPPASLREALRAGEFTNKQGKITVRFYGAYIPLHGVEYIVQAAKLLENDSRIRFELLGDGQTYPAARAFAEESGLKNLAFIGRRIPYNELPAWIAGADICFGIFGKTGKTLRVIPNKVYECVAMKKPVITADTPAIRELFNERELYLVPPADSRALADAITRLASDAQLRQRYAEAAYAKFVATVTPAAVAKELLNTLTINKITLASRCHSRESGNPVC